MKTRKNLALGLSGLGLILAIAGPLLPGGIHLAPNDPPRTGHVTDLVATAGGDILAGTQAGEVWRFRDGVWTRINQYLGEQPVIAMLGEPGRAPVGTAGGLYFAPVGAPPLEERVGSLLATDQGLLAGTATGVRRLVNGVWQVLEPKANIYCLHDQRTDAGHWWHAGTIGAGVFSTPAGDPATAWRANSEGLPADVKVFGFATSRGGRLLAGTDQGLFWQTRPGEVWRSLHPELKGQRVLSLHLTTDGGAQGAERLWIGRDDGLYSFGISDEDDGLITEDPLLPADTVENQPPFGIGRIVSAGDRIMVGAGAVYEYGPTQLRGWYWISLAGVILILIAGWLMPRPPSATPGAGAD
ncbi:ABC transporter substrate-binding protein [Thiocystis violacea]|uniref:ABC transporter substrate-binding protein n=1 Tax=Thiocystis violacea TaxID=13725 RepID=UPI00190552DE|nr:ABC transporter substrate-binding protein [Thiocystis violacea]MBK1718942.1 ABC transporter substrate-binding protein [Thiocystis violacea]